mmetsp:Transcript_237/g.545  ORF Transcript_237/g.545 Transcript_237/m.545 type:complete len:505 (-) Transcript_237:359-1873(-)
MPCREEVAPCAGKPAAPSAASSQSSAPTSLCSRVYASSCCSPLFSCCSLEFSAARRAFSASSASSWVRTVSFSAGSSTLTPSRHPPRSLLFSATSSSQVRDARSRSATTRVYSALRRASSAWMAAAPAGDLSSADAAPVLRRCAGEPCTSIDTDAAAPGAGCVAPTARIMAPSTESSCCCCGLGRAAACGEARACRWLLPRDCGVVLPCMGLGDVVAAAAAGLVGACAGAPASPCELLRGDRSTRLPPDTGCVAQLVLVALDVTSSSSAPPCLLPACCADAEEPASLAARALPGWCGCAAAAACCSASLRACSSAASSAMGLNIWSKLASSVLSRLVAFWPKDDTPVTSASSRPAFARACLCCSAALCACLTAGSALLAAASGWAAGACVAPADVLGWAAWVAAAALMLSALAGCFIILTAPSPPFLLLALAAAGLLSAGLGLCALTGEGCLLLPRDSASAEMSKMSAIPRDRIFVKVSTTPSTTSPERPSGTVDPRLICCSYS